MERKRLALVPRPSGAKVPLRGVAPVETPRALKPPGPVPEDGRFQPPRDPPCPASQMSRHRTASQLRYHREPIEARKIQEHIWLDYPSEESQVNSYANQA